MNRAPFFLVGAPRSGTTLLQYMLRSHPALSLPSGESHFIVPLLLRAADYGPLDSPEAARRVLHALEDRHGRFLREDLHGMRFDIEQFTTPPAENMAALIARIFSANAAGEGKQRWGDKTPYYALHIPLLARAFPGAQFIHLIRDGRDCALSMLARARDLGIRDLAHAAWTWRRYVETARRDGRALGTSRYFELHYESLLDAPEATLKGLCEFLAVDFDAALITFGKPRRAVKTPLLGAPLASDNRDKWRQAMTPWQRRVFEAEAGATLATCGYAPSCGGWLLPATLRTLHRGRRQLAWWRTRLTHTAN